MTDWAETRAREWLHTYARTVVRKSDGDLQSLAALLREVAGEGSIGLGIAMGKTELLAEVRRVIIEGDYLSEDEQRDLFSRLGKL